MDCGAEHLKCTARARLNASTSLAKEYKVPSTDSSTSWGPPSVSSQWSPRSVLPTSALRSVPVARMSLSVSWLTAVLVLRHGGGCPSLVVLNMAVPGIHRVRRPEEAAKLVEKEPAVVPAEEVAQQLLGMAAAFLHVDRLEDGDDVLEHEFRIVLSSAPSVLRSGTAAVFGGAALTVVVEELKDLQLPAYPPTSARQEVGVVIEALRRDVSVPGGRAGADVERVEAIPVDMAPSCQDAPRTKIGVGRRCRRQVRRWTKSWPPPGLTSRGGGHACCRGLEANLGHLEGLVALLGLVGKVEVDLGHVGFTKRACGLELEPTGEAEEVEVVMATRSCCARLGDLGETDDADLLSKVLLLLLSILFAHLGCGGTHTA